MKRTAPLRRTGRQRARYADPDVLAEYRWAHDCCAACWRTERSPDVLHLDLHHMFGRLCRPDATWGILLLCQRWGEEGCHERLGHGRENLAVCLRIKADMSEYDPAAMQGYLRRFGNEILPEPAVLPAWIEEARSQFHIRGA